MNASEGVADLHMHTTASDGTCGVADRRSQASERGLESIAITDHDDVSTDLENPSVATGTSSASRAVVCVPTSDTPKSKCLDTT